MPASKQKVSVASSQEATPKVRKLQQLVLKQKATLSDVRAENRKLKREKKALAKSKDNWKREKGFSKEQR